MRRISILIVMLFALQICGCGTVLHPERKGQTKSYRLDPAVAVLDGVGVLFFLIPGLLAFAVDFHYGTIFLPPDKNAYTDNKKLKIVHVDPNDLNTNTIENILKNETGYDIKLTQENLMISELKDRNEVLNQAETSPESSLGGGFGLIVGEKEQPGWKETGEWGRGPIPLAGEADGFCWNIRGKEGDRPGRRTPTG